MSSAWSEWIVWGLAACTAIVATVEFYGGKQFQSWIKDKLEAWWIRLSYVRVPTIGLQEAMFTEMLMRRLFGTTLSSQRVVVSFCLPVVFHRAWHSVGLSTPEGDSISSLTDLLLYIGLEVAVASITAFVSLAITYEAIVRSIRWVANRRFSSAYFLIALILTVAASAVVLLLVDWLMGQLFDNTITVGGPTDMERVWGQGSVAVTDTTELVREWSSTEWVLVHMGYTLVALRLTLFVAFGVWAATGFILQAIKLTLYRLFEAQKGVLTIFCGGITAAGSGVKWLLEHAV